ncbi:MAG: hypothetical protein B7733_18805 [Myxococcales bacterium FL481]|nr:MAG: hypothetical protein B7733_18805 [Myxococcales bacterium FL481]
MGEARLLGGFDRASRSTMHKTATSTKLWHKAAWLGLATAFSFALSPQALAWGKSGDPIKTVDILELSTETDAFTRLSGPSGPTTFGYLGTPVSGGFDLDGDGNNDLAVGHLTSTSAAGRPFAGEVNVVFGDGALGNAIDLDTPGSHTLKVIGDGDFEATGNEVWMGDITGDGLGDLLICRQNYDPGGRIGAGAVTVVPGSPVLRDMAEDGEVLDLRSPPEDLEVLTFAGAAEHDRLGIWVRTGDVDGDGVDELLMAADQVSSDTATFAGAVFVVRGGEHLHASGLIDLADFGSTDLAGNLAKISAPPGAEDFHLGATLQAGDLDRNGRDEVMIAAALNRAGAVLSPDGQFTGDAIGGPDHGRLYVLWDDNFPAIWPPGLEIDLACPHGSLSVLNGGEQNLTFGEEVLGGSDYNGDGKPDLFVGDLTGDGTKAQDRPFSGVGYVFYHARKLKNRVINMDKVPRKIRYSKILGPVTGAIGSDTVADGDFNGDGVDDLAIGNPHDNPLGRVHAGTLHVLWGKKHRRWPRLIDTAPGQLPPSSRVKITLVVGALGDDPTGDPPSGGDTLCYSAAAGDINDDGLVDLITNEMVGNGVAPEAVDVGNLVAFGGDVLSP